MPAALTSVFRSCENSRTELAAEQRRPRAQTRDSGAPAVTSASLVFVVVQRLPKADPDIQQSEAAAQAAEKAVCDQIAKTGIGEQQVVVGPFGRPGQNHEQNTGDRAHQDKEQHADPVNPHWYPALPSCALLPR